MAPKTKTRIQTEPSLKTLFFNLNHEFEDTHQKVGPVHYADQTGEYSVMTAQLFFQRRFLFHNFNFVLPCALITVLVVIGFALPCESGEKIGLRKQNVFCLIIYSYVCTRGYLKFFFQHVC